ncbi:hypothetical protein PsalMR5_01664 [Piscirickettsia salmonis]|uniref:hypothetical protein n=1 Tax=Piscirickettsia salmonis TaxID=1238 RepID=UPI0012BAAB2C|nr:hypothetical protein [Piscirickettsia salmonis]QGP54223.1 hypothetical protein PsalSR1_01655 [Piscirickettsia salmonis]QGP59878.1 hypothetical protein PsalBI1_02475 [Piscirickettsia salmonis]QGP63800.1 hypothetical protein PsalMR5_01664 [Piscirickettsia salmonis]
MPSPGNLDDNPNPLDQPAAGPEPASDQPIAQPAAGPEPAYEMAGGQPIAQSAAPAEGQEECDPDAEEQSVQDQAEAAADQERSTAASATEKEKKEKKKRLTEMRDALGKSHEDMGKQPERGRSISKQHRDKGNELTQRMEKLSNTDPKNVTDEEKNQFMDELKALGREANQLAMSDKEKVLLRGGFLGTLVSLFQKFITWDREYKVDFQLEAIKDQAEALKQKFDSELSEYNTAGADGPKPGGTGPKCADDEEDADNQRDEEKKKKQKEEMMKEFAM